jgi:hypothetical protein
MLPSHKYNKQAWSRFVQSFPFYRQCPVHVAGRGFPPASVLAFIVLRPTSTPPPLLLATQGLLQ